MTFVTWEPADGDGFACTDVDDDGRQECRNQAVWRLVWEDGEGDGTYACANHIDPHSHYDDRIVPHLDDR